MASHKKHGDHGHTDHGHADRERADREQAAPAIDPGPAGGSMPGASAAAPGAAPSREVREVEAELDAALAKVSENYDLFLRARAEGDNIRRRAQEDIAKAHKFAIESFAEQLVPVVDSLEKALEARDAPAETMRAGTELIYKQLLAAFEKGRLAPIDPAGEKFDPHLHQAISMAPAPAGVPPGHVVSVLQKGWRIAERVLRPALVIVAQGD
jgi:molecular chaperone GrpE